MPYLFTGDPHRGADRGHHRARVRVLRRHAGRPRLQDLRHAERLRTRRSASPTCVGGSIARAAVLRRLTSPGVRRRAVATAPHLQVNTTSHSHQQSSDTNDNKGRTCEADEHSGRSTALSIAGLLVAACGSDDEDSATDRTAAAATDRGDDRPRPRRPTAAPTRRRRPPAAAAATCPRRRRTGGRRRQRAPRRPAPT